ncbi:MAG: hypothetical protein WBQ66_12085, partial [Blastocatellia bacterium]
LAALRDFSQVLDDESVHLAQSFPDQTAELEAVFKQTFDFIAVNGSDRVFRRWDATRGEFKGSFLITAFEVFALGIGYHVANGTAHKQDLITVVKEFWERDEMKGGYATGRSTEKRMSEFVPLGRTVMTAV